MMLDDLEALHLFDAMNDAVYLLDPDTSTVVWCNRNAYEVLGLSADEVLNHSVLSLQKDVTGLPQWQDIAQAIRSVPCFTFIGRHRHANGGEVSVEVNTTQVVLSNRTYFLSVARDITDRLNLCQTDGAEHQLAFVMNEALDGLWDWRLTDDSVVFSPSLKRMLGYGPNEMEPRVATWKDNIHPDDLAYVMQIMEQHLKGSAQRFETEYRLRNRNGDYLWVHDRGKVCERDEMGHPLRAVGMVQNVTDRKTLELSLAHFAHIDSLTLLPNRRAGDIESERRFGLARSTPEAAFTLAVADIDYFKRINDQYGHQTGDEILRAAAKVLMLNVSDKDYVFRWGGEEFVLLLAGDGIQYAQRVCDLIHQGLSNIDWQSRYGVEPVSMSIGLAMMSHNSIFSLSELIHHADQAMYAAKQMGRNCTHCYLAPA